jgi:hypothetical protein
MAGWERKKIKERVKRGVKEKKLQGHFWGTTVPSGYVKDKKGKLVPNPVRIEKTGKKKGNYYTIFSAEEVKDIFNSYLSGHSIKSIADRMESFDTTIAPILDRAMFYAGYILDMKDDRKVMAKGLHEPLISEFQAERVLQLRGERQKVHQESREKYPALGLIRCGLCNSPLHLKVGIKPTRRYYYYTCSNKKLASIRHTTCTLPSKQIHHIEEKIWKTVEKIVISPEVVFQMLTNSNSLKEQSRERLVRAEKELAELEQRKKRVMELYEFTNTDQEMREMKVKLSKLESQIQSKRRQKTELEAEFRMQEATPQKHREIIKTLEILQEVVTEANTVEKRKIIRLLFDTILLHPDGQMSYKLQIPIWNMDAANQNLVSQKLTTEYCSLMRSRSSSGMCLRFSGSRLKTGK